MAGHIERGEILKRMYTPEHDTLQIVLPKGANLLGNHFSLKYCAYVQNTILIACHGILHWINFRHY